jgi:hypothetical protein
LPDGSARLFDNLAWDGTQDEATLGHSTFFADLLDGLYHKEENYYQRYGAYGDDGVYDEDIDDSMTSSRCTRPRTSRTPTPRTRTTRRRTP